MGILLCEFNNEFKFSSPLDPRMHTSKLHLRYATMLKVHVIIIVLKCSIYLHEHVILLLKGLTMTKLFTICLLNELIEMKYGQFKADPFEDHIFIHINVIIHEFLPYLNSSMSITTLSILR